MAVPPPSVHTLFEVGLRISYSEAFLIVNCAVCNHILYHIDGSIPGDDVATVIAKCATHHCHHTGGPHRSIPNVPDPPRT